MTFLYLLRVKVHFEISPILNLSINGDIVNMVNLTETKKIIPCHTLLCQFFLNKVLMCLKFFSYELFFFFLHVFHNIYTCMLSSHTSFFISLVWPISPFPLQYQYVMRNIDMGNKCSSYCFVVMEFNQKIHFLFKGVGFYLKQMYGMFYPNIYRHMLLSKIQDKCGYDIVYLQVE